MTPILDSKLRTFVYHLFQLCFYAPEAGNQIRQELEINGIMKEDKFLYPIPEEFQNQILLYTDTDQMLKIQNLEFKNNPRFRHTE